MSPANNRFRNQMNFLAPAAFAFAATIAVVIVFYLLKRKRTVKLVSSTLLWQKFLAETQANAPFQRLRHNWLLMLQLLLLLFVILALSRPYFAGKSTGGNLFVLILDASASMQSTDESPTRFEKARQEALDEDGDRRRVGRARVLPGAEDVEEAERDGFRGPPRGPVSKIEFGAELRHGIGRSGRGRVILELRQLGKIAVDRR